MGRFAPRVAGHVLAVLILAACGQRADDHEEEVESWSVTAWGERYEIFPEVDPLVAGATSPAHTHVTILDGFQALTAGTVEIVLRGAGGEQVFSANEPVRPGIFNVNVAPAAEGDYELAFRIRSAAGDEEIPGGSVKVGTEQSPGGLTREPVELPAAETGQPVPFLKEEQWRTAFATEWVREGKLAESARGLARVRTPAGGDAVLTANVDGVLQTTPWPFPGQEVGAGQTVFRVVPRVASERSLPELRAEQSGLESELANAKARLGRLEELLAVEATSRREVEEARANAATLESRLDASRRDLAAATAAREGKAAAEAHAVRAPFAGRVAALSASPGAAVAAGEALGRVVRSGPVWLEVDLRPAGAARLAAQGASGLVVETPDGAAHRLATDRVRLVSLAPEVDASRGTVAALVEVDAPGFVLGTTVEAEILFAGERTGIVVPATALVDDGGVSVVYLQLSGESFARQPVEIVTRQGELALVTGLTVGQRLVTRGGESIRRSSLVSKGMGEAHVH
jgi:cobalt-zinc-cadmium efflux system membrane fusion protein